MNTDTREEWRLYMAGIFAYLFHAAVAMMIYFAARDFGFAIGYVAFVALFKACFLEQSEGD